ncbi:Unknown protein [Striga hermonthica]|uniref:Uncharacterized protein n=1 Tax=Striga hermonthica TaxID=68872 RepID=A0A9N7MRJ7_STRHE|nr:Unknown protein [Striga hermonthica]
MGDFLHDLMNMMEQNVVAEKEESLEDLQKTFVDLFGEDLAGLVEQDDPMFANRASAPKKRNFLVKKVNLENEVISDPGP